MFGCIGDAGSAGWDSLIPKPDPKAKLMLIREKVCQTYCNTSIPHDGVNPKTRAACARCSALDLIDIELGGMAP